MTDSRGKSDLTLDRLFRKAGQSVLAEWGIEGELDDLAQDLWVWYLESPGTQSKLAGMEAGEKVSAVRKAANQIVSEKVLEGDVASGRVLYSSEAIKDHLKGESSNKFLNGLMPKAMNVLAARNAGHAQAIIDRYENGEVPEPGAKQVTLSRALKSLTAEVNVTVLSEENKGRNAIFPELRRKKGEHSDPTLDAVLGLLSENANKEIKTVNSRREQTGRTTYRHEMLSVFDDWFAQTVPPEGSYRSDLNVMESSFNGGHRSELYRAQVTPDLFPNEGRMLIENWSAEDREMYCGGVFTKGTND